MKEKILNISSIDELERLENNILEEYRNNLYNELLKDDEIKHHLSKVFDVKEEVLDNALLINGETPIDDFDN